MADSSTPKGPADLDRAIEELQSGAADLVTMAPSEKAALVRSMIPRALSLASSQVEASCVEKGLDPTSPLAGEEWLAGPCVTLGLLRHLADALEDIASSARPKLPKKAVRVRNGRVEVQVYPLSTLDAAMLRRVDAYALIQDGVDRASVGVDQAEVYQRGAAAEACVALVIGSGGITSSPASDVLSKLLVEGRAVLLVLSPADAYLSPFLEAIFAPLIEKRFLRIVCADAGVGAELASHAGVGAVHFNGSAADFDAMVWGPPGPDRDLRKAEGDPLVKKSITSALGGVSPILVTPWLYAKDELWFQARSVASQVVYNAPLCCGESKMLVMPRTWPQRRVFLDMVRKALAEAPPRRVYQAGLFDRYRQIRKDRGSSAWTAVTPEGCVPWTIVEGLDPRDTKEPLFSSEPLGGVLSEVEVGSTDLEEFLVDATTFCNERLWGTLSASLLVHALHEESEVASDAVDKAVRELRYGVLGINQWPGLAYALVAPPWGPYPGSTLADAQSGTGFVHNTLMLGRVEKTVVTSPLRTSARPPYFYDNRRRKELGERYALYSAEPGWGRALWAAATAAITARGR